MAAEENVKLILPKERYEWRSKDGPLIFLAGPIRGGGDWQKEACLRLADVFDKDFCVAVPCRWDEQHPLFEYRVSGLSRFDYQLNWERHYLELAARKGCILFWLPCESKTNPHPGPEPYAMDTRGELGEWRGRLMHDGFGNCGIVIGAEPGFHGLSQIKRNFSFAIGEEFEIKDTLDATVRSAVGIALNLP